MGFPEETQINGRIKIRWDKPDMESIDRTLVFECLGCHKTVEVSWIEAYRLTWRIGLKNDL